MKKGWPEERSQKQSARLKGNTYRRGVFASATTLLRMHISRLGNKNTLGYKPSQLTRLKMSEAQKRRWNAKQRQKWSEKYSYQANPNWKGGKSFETYSRAFQKELKELIRLRDGYICQLCSIPECECNRRLDVHHIDYDKHNCLPTNLISLCRTCNGRANSKRNYWVEHFRQRLNEMQRNPLSIRKPRLKFRRDIKQRTKVTPGVKITK